jgi:Radical SAM superfamily/Domain of unknown function (DUF4070)
MSTSRITFVHAPVCQHDHHDTALFSPLWAYTLAAYVPATWEVAIADCLLEDPAKIARAEVFAFSGTNQDIDSLTTVHSLLKAKYPSATFVLGGPITWSLEREGKLHLLDFFDRLFVLDGEQTLPAFLQAFERGLAASLPKVIRGARFELEQARPVRFDLLRDNVDKYYGASIEVSRGCPFLCEFCDVRVLPDNNRANNKSPDLIALELDSYFAMGISQFLFVCDNFIGDVTWARACVDAILAWQSRTGARLSIFTWATINIAKMPDLMTKMRRAGFTVLYIGIESVNEHALLETAKVQNRVALAPAVERIQSFGFIIAPGFIFGFDSDGPTLFDDTLAFIIENGLIGGDPSFLTAMPGTPLFERMRATSRLVDGRANATSRRKIATNIRYLMDARVLVRGFVGFIEDLTDAGTQLRRFRRHVEQIEKSDRFVAVEGTRTAAGSRKTLRFLRLQLAHRAGRASLTMRVTYLVRSPSRILAVLRGWWLVRTASRRNEDMGLHWSFWVYAWTSVGLRYRGLREEDLSLHFVPQGFDLASLAREPGSAADVGVERLARRNAKEETQLRYTKEALARLVANKSKGSVGTPAK